MLLRSLLLALFLSGCAAQDIADSPEGTVIDEIGDPYTEPDPGDDTPADPLNLSFEWPRIDVDDVRPDAWEIDEDGDARSYATRADGDAVDGNQFLVLEIDGDGSTWALSPPLSVLAEGFTTHLSFGIRSDCTDAVLSMRAGSAGAGFAILPTSSNWADVSFSLAPTASQSGKDFSIEIINDSSSPCALEVDHFRID